MTAPLTVAIVGAESTGKTTLASALAEHYGVPWVREFARDYLATHGARYQEVDLSRIAEGQVHAEEQAASPLLTLLIADTDLLVISIWSEVRYGRIHRDITDGLRRAQTRPRLYLLTAPDMPWVPDPLRENPDDRDALHDRYLQRLQTIGTPFKVVSGTHVERLSQSTTFIDSMFHPGR